MSKGNTSVSGVFDIIQQEIIEPKSLSKGYCHGNVAKAIREKKVSVNDEVCLLGTGSSIMHSIIRDTSGNILVDTFFNNLVDHNGDQYRYMKNGINVSIHVIAVKKVKDFTR